LLNFVFAFKMWNCLYNKCSFNFTRIYADVFRDSFPSTAHVSSHPIHAVKNFFISESGRGIAYVIKREYNRHTIAAPDAASDTYRSANYYLDAVCQRLETD
jgi:hypothetical protein